MTNILADKIQAAKLTKTQQKIAKYFIRNQERIGSLSSVEAAKEIGVSDASIIRFSRAIGYEGFADLKADIYNALVEDAFSALSLNERMVRSTMQYTGSDISAQFLELMQKNVANSFMQNEEAKYAQVADLLIGAPKRYIIGLRGCRGVAVQFSRLINFMLPNVICLQDSECTSINALQDAGEDDVVLMFAFARYYKVDVHYMELAKKRGAKICLVVDEVFSPLISYADVVLLTETAQMSFFNSMLGAVMIGEYILTLISRQVDFQKRMQERDEITKDQRL